jgi:hypothetical protein
MAVCPEDLIRHGAAIGRLLEDESVQTVFADLENKYFRDWKAAKTPEERELQWAKASALGDLKFVLEQTVASGEAEQHAADMREKHEAEMRKRKNQA